MKIKHDDKKVHLLPIDRITILNARSRGKPKFKQIVSNIAALGLKKPITVARRVDADGQEHYVLACGQGRMEAYLALGQQAIPALIIEASDEEVMLISLAENLARRPRTTVELAKEIHAMKERGYSPSDIAQKVDLHPSYVKGLLKLLQNEETCLLTAVERRKLPLSVAVAIADSRDEDVQKAMTEAYENGELRGKSLLWARRLIERRRAKGKSARGGWLNQKPVTANDLLAAYKKESARQRLLLDRAALCETRVRFIVSAVRRLLADESFVNLLRAEGLATLPQYLIEQAKQGEASHGG
jgi:ParB family transcriptional regulator, chromosome partitioning protein